MTPVAQRTLSDCTQAALASVLDCAYEDLPAFDGNNEVAYNASIAQVLSSRGLLMLCVPYRVLVDSVATCPGSVPTFCLASVASKRFPGREHHVVARVSVEPGGWLFEIVHDPYRLEGPYEIHSLDFLVRAFT